jgi:hypothetical protein
MPRRGYDSCNRACIVIHPLRSRALPLLALVAASGCRDANRTSERPAADSTVQVVRSDSSIDAKDVDGSRESAAPTASIVPDTSAAGVVRRYYYAIRNREFETAYELWDRSGEASGKTRSEFASGFAQTAQAVATVGDSVSVEGAAGSQFATVPVTVDAVLRGGTRQHFVGSYTLRRTIVDGATAEQRTWHIYSAHLQQR